MDRDWIAFVGPPGAGKSTLLEKLADDPKYVDVYRKGYLNLLYWDSMILAAIPEKIKNTLELKIKNCICITKFDDFIINNRHLLTTVIKDISNCGHKPEALFSRWRRSIQRYELAMGNLPSDIIPLFDEGIHQQILKINWYSRNNMDLLNYLRLAPTPSVLVLVDAPPYICLSRQKKRGSVTVDKSWNKNIQEEQRYLNDTATQLRKILDETNIPVIYVDNSGDLENSFMFLKRELDTYI